MKVRPIKSESEIKLDGIKITAIMEGYGGCVSAVLEDSSGHCLVFKPSSYNALSIAVPETKTVWVLVTDSAWGKSEKQFSEESEAQSALGTLPDGVTGKIETREVRSE